MADRPQLPDDELVQIHLADHIAAGSPHLDYSTLELAQQTYAGHHYRFLTTEAVEELGLNNAQSFKPEVFPDLRMLHPVPYNEWLKEASRG